MYVLSSLAVLVVTIVGGAYWGTNSKLDVVLVNQGAQGQIVSKIQEQQSKDIADLKLMREQDRRLYDQQINSLKSNLLDLKAEVKGVK